MTEKTIATYTTENFRLQLLEITTPIMQIAHDENFKPYETEQYYYKKTYQVRLNRKIVKTSISEYQMRKLFAMYVQNQVLQLKIY